MITGQGIPRRRLQIALTLLMTPLLWMLFRHHHFTRLLSTVSLGWLAAAVLICGLEMGVKSWKAAWLTAGRVTLWQQVRINCVKVFANQLLPGGFGGETLRVLWMAPKMGSLGRSAAMVVLDRLSGFYVQLTATLISFAVLLGISSRSTLRMLGVGAALAAAGTFVLPWFLRHLLPVFAGWVRRFGGRDLPGEGRDAAEFEAAWKETLGAGGRLLRLLALTAAVQTTLIALTMAAGRAVGTPVSPWQASPIMLLSAFSSLAPITIGNLGVTEGAFAAGFALFGYRPESGVAASLCLRLVLSPAALFGGWTFLRASVHRTVSVTVPGTFPAS